jgi:hypothetical protein
MTDQTAARWHDLYQRALFEENDSLILEHITAAEHAIAARARELFSSPDDYVDEVHALDAARYALRALRGAVLRRNSAGMSQPGLSPSLGPRAS